MTTCSVTLTFGPRVLTNVTPLGKTPSGRYLKIPLPADIDLIDLAAVSMLLGVKRKTISNLLSAHRDRMSKPFVYRPCPKLRRFLRPEDVDTLRVILPLYVKI